MAIKTGITPEVWQRDTRALFTAVDLIAEMDSKDDDEDDEEQEA